MINSDDQIFIQYRPASGVISFGRGEVTDEMVKGCPKDSVLIQLGDIVSVSSEKQGDNLSDIIDLWFVVYVKDNKLYGTVCRCASPDVVFPQVGISWDVVVYATRVTERELENGRPLFIGW